MALELANYTASRNIPVKELPVTSTGTQLGIITKSFKQVFHIQFQYRRASTGTKTTGLLGRLTVMPCSGSKAQFTSDSYFTNIKHMPTE